MLRRWRRPHYYGWWMIWTLAVTETVSWGILFYAFSVFIVPMQQELGWSTAEITGAYSLALVVAMLVSPPIGRWLDRAGPRLPMTLGSALAAALVVAWSRVDSLPAFYAIWAAIGAAQTGGRFAITVLERRAPAVVMAALVFALQAVAMAIIILPVGLAVLLLAVALLGIGRGGTTLLRATLVADRYGRANFATISGIPAATQMAARAIAPVGAGLLVSWWGGYAPMLVVLTGVAVAATLAMVMFARSARPLSLFDEMEE